MSDFKDTEILKNTLVDRFGKDITSKLFDYIDKVLERNQFINLTAIKDRDEAMQKHLADSLAIIDLPEFINANNIIDIGTGAGFPGALLAIAYPEKKFVLMDSTLKRLKVIDEFASELGINNITTVHSRAEEAARKSEFKESFDLCVSRAVANLEKLSGWCLPFVKSDGYFAPYKGENYKEELDTAEASIKKLHGVFERAETINGGSDDISGHVILIIRKK